MNKFRRILPSVFILISIFLARFQGQWFYGAVGFTMAITLFLFFRALRSVNNPPLSRSLLLMPLVFLVGMFGTVAASPFSGTLFGILGCCLFYYYYRDFPKAVPEFMMQSMTLFTAFMFSAFVWSLNYFFTPSPWMIIVMSTAGFLALFWTHLSVLGSWVGALVMAEITWVLLFWPAHFFTLAVVSLAVFYLIYMLSFLYFADRLSVRKIFFQVSLISVVVIVTLLSSAWQPISRT